MTTRSDPAVANNSSSIATAKHGTAFVSHSTSNGQRSSGATFARSVSACWNNPSLPETSYPSTIPVIASASTSQPSRKTTCLFCPNIVVLPALGERNARLENFIGNLCKHFKIQRSELPGQCTKEMFPFCPNTCEKLVIKLWKQEEALRVILQNIDRTVNEIEQAVANGWILEDRGKPPTTSSMAMLEQLKVTKLKDLILARYSDKLYRNLDIVRGTIPTEEGTREDLEIENHDEENVTENWANGVQNNHEASEDDCVNDEQIQLETQAVELGTVKSEHQEQLRDVAISVVGARSVEDTAEDGNGYDQDEHHHLNLPPPLHQEYERYSHEEQQYQQEEATGGEQDQPWFVHPNLVIANENDEAGVPSGMEIKPEALDTATNAYEPEEGEVYALKNRKRRFLYEGVEIFTASGAGRYASMNYLQCSACSYTVPLPKHKSGSSSRYMILKTHILHTHKNKTGLPKIPHQREHICVICNQKFSSRQQMREHKATHPSDGMVTCDICMKPMPGKNKANNLFRHKFTHKNDEERRVAFANGERGSSAALLSRRKTCTKFSSSKNTHTKVRTNSARKQVNQPKQNPERTEAYIPNVKQYCCGICDRSFGRKCNLEKHRICQHLSTQTLSPSSSSESEDFGMRTMSSPERHTSSSILDQFLSNDEQPVRNLDERGVHQNLGMVRLMPVPRVSLNVKELNGVGSQGTISYGGQ